MKTIDLSLVQKIVDNDLASFYHAEFTEGNTSQYTIFRGNDDIAIVSLGKVDDPQLKLIFRETRPDLDEATRGALKTVAYHLGSDIGLELSYVKL